MGMEIGLSKDQFNKLVTIESSKWSELKHIMKTHYESGSYMLEAYAFLVALTYKQWQNVSADIEKTRLDNKQVLKTQRSAVKAVGRKAKKTEYMRDYMQRYRLRKEQHSGQGGITQSG